MPAPDSLLIRPATAADLGAVDALLSASYPKLLKADYPPSILVTALPLISRAQPRLISSGTYYVAEGDGGTILAAGGWTWIGPQGPVGPPDMAHVRHVVCDHRATRRGIAGRLMRHAMAEARAAGVRLLDCQSTRTAVPFYAALGFQEIGQIEIRLRPGILFPAVHMQARLDRGPP